MKPKTTHVKRIPICSLGVFESSDTDTLRKEEVCNLAKMLEFSLG